MKMDRVGTVDSVEIRPEKFGRYVLLDRIGAGGMAEVFRAVMPGVEGFQRTFVVKRILGERAKSPYFVDMFVQEARINALLHHPNIVQVFDFGNVGGTYFLAMEYVRGRDVSEILRRLRNHDRPCPVGIATFIAHEVAAALGYAHALTGSDGTPLHIVHRDISPSNIICLRAGGVKLLDFGIAKAIGEPEVEKTGQGMFKGKLSYIAPERIKDLPVDGRSDLFSLGVVLWELLAGQKLFRGKSDLQTLKNVAEMEIPAPSALRPDVPPELDRVVLKALARDPALRYPTGQALAEDLDRVLESLRYQTRALPDLLHELYGSELSSRQIPNAALTNELLAACAAETSNVSAGGPTYPAGQLPSTGDEYSISIGTVVPVRPRPGPISWAAAIIGTAALVLLAFGRGGGGRTQAAPVAAAAASAEAAPPPTPPTETLSPAAAVKPAPAAEAAPAQTPAKPAHHAHYSGKGRVTRGLSVDPFAEAASRAGK
jgi:serine/threonine-protein kinase